MSAQAIRKNRFSLAIGDPVICTDSGNNPRLILGQVYRVTGVSVMSRYLKVMVGSRSGIYLRDRFAIVLFPADWYLLIYLTLSCACLCGVGWVAFRYGMPWLMTYVMTCLCRMGELCCRHVIDDGISLTYVMRYAITSCYHLVMYDITSTYVGGAMEKYF